MNDFARGWTICDGHIKAAMMGMLMWSWCWSEDAQGRGWWKWLKMVGEGEDGVERTETIGNEQVRNREV